MIGVLQFIFAVVVGHLTGALVLYLNHRFIFHGKLGRFPILRSMRKLHTLHHRHRVAHNGDTSGFARHHAYHHRKADVNFSGVYPVYDRIFFTYERPK